MKDQIENGTNTFDLIQDHFKMQNKDMPKNINGKDFIRKLSSIKDLGRLLKEKDIKKKNNYRILKFQYAIVVISMIPSYPASALVGT